MLVCFDENGVLKEQLDSYGNLPRVDTQKFKIFAYFKDIELANYGAAYIRFQRPDLGDSKYPILFMTRANLTYDPTIISPSQSEYFNANNNPYPCYLFDFSMVKDTMGTETTDDDKIVSILDMPGQWLATITLISTANDNVTNVVGTISFNVDGVAPETEPNDDISYDVITHNTSLVLAQKLNTEEVYYVREMKGFEAKAAAGQLPKGFFVEGSVVFDSTEKTFYKINSVSDATNEDYVYCSNYTKLVDLDDKLDVSSGILVVPNIYSLTMSDYATGQYFYSIADKCYYRKNDLGNAEQVENGSGILGSNKVLIRYQINADTKISDLADITNDYSRLITVKYNSKDYILETSRTTISEEVYSYSAVAFDVIDRCFYSLKDLTEDFYIAQRLFLFANRIDHVDLKTTPNTLYGVNSSGEQVNIAISELLSDYATKSTVPDYQANMAMINDVLININGVSVSEDFGYERISVDSKPAYHIIDAVSEENLTQEQAKNYLRAMTGSEYLPEYDPDKPSSSFMMLLDGTILKPQWDNSYGLLLYFLNTYADVNYVNNNILTLSSSGTTLTNEEYAYTLTKNACVLNSNTGIYYEKYSEDANRILFKALNIGITNDSGVVTLANTPALVITKSTKRYDFGAGPTEQTYGKSKLDADFATKQYVQQQIEDIRRNSLQNVDTTEYPTLQDFLDSEGEEGYIYLYPVDLNDINKGFYQYTWEYIAADDAYEWEYLGTTQIDVSEFTVSFEQRSFANGAVSVTFKNNTDYKLISLSETVSVNMIIPSGVSQGWVSSCTFTVGNSVPTFSLTNNSNYNVVFIVNNRKASISDVRTNLDRNGIVECMAECNGFDIRVYMKEVSMN